MVSRHIQFSFLLLRAKTINNLLGARDSARLKLVEKSDEVKVNTVQVDGSELTRKVHADFADVFEGLGSLEGSCHIHLKEDSVPVIYPARKVPVHIRNELKADLQSLESQGVLCQTTEPTDWVLPLVIVPKPSGKLRICVDPLELNKYIRREHCHLPHRSEIKNAMAGAQYFSKMDAAQGFYHLQLDAASQKLCTVATPFGRYSF